MLIMFVTVAYGLRQLGYEVKYLPSLALNQHFGAFDILSNHLDIDRAIVRELLVARDFTVKLNNYDVKQIGQKIKSYKNDDYLIIGSIMHLWLPKFQDSIWMSL